MSKPKIFTDEQWKEMDSIAVNIKTQIDKKVMETILLFGDWCFDTDVLFKIINGKEFNLEDYEGFIYIITNKTNGKFYVGKKTFWNTHKLPALKGRTKKEKLRRSKLKGNKRHVKKESDWKNYWGSSKELLKNIEELGEDKFERRILRLCKTKWEMSYYEALEQFNRDVIFLENCYNGILNLRVPKAPKHLRK